MKNSNLHILFSFLLIVSSTLPARSQPTARQLEKEAHETYQEAYETTGREKQAKLFKKAAEQFEAAAEAYRKENNEKKAKEMEGWARAARSNAEIRKPNDQLDKLSFSGPGFKQLSRPSRGSSLEAGVAMDFPLNRKVESDYFPKETFEQIRMAVYADPAMVEKLLDNFGGEFFIGAFSGEPAFSQPDFPSKPGYGLTVNWRPFPSLSIQTALLHSRSSVTAEFPVTVINFTGGDTHPELGTIFTAWQQWQYSAGGQWFFLNGSLRPFLGAGAQWNYYVGIETQMKIGGQELSLSANKNENKMDGYATMGLNFQPAPRLSIGGGLVWTGGLQDSPAGQRATFSGRISLCWRFR